MIIYRVFQYGVFDFKAQFWIDVNVDIEPFISEDLKNM